MKDEQCFGGAVAVEYEEFARKWMNLYMPGWKCWGTVFNMKQGAAQFCRKSVFEKLNGYDTGIYVGEDIEFYWRLTKFAKQNAGHAFFIEHESKNRSSRGLDRISFWKTFILINPITICEIGEEKIIVEGMVRKNDPLIFTLYKT